MVEKYISTSILLKEKGLKQKGSKYFVETTGNSFYASMDPAAVARWNKANKRAGEKIIMCRQSMKRYGKSWSVVRTECTSTFRR